MDPTVIAAAIGVGGTVIVGVVGFWSTKTASDRAAQVATNNTVRALGAARDERIWDRRAQAYAEFLTSISVSYAKAEAHKGDPEEADLLRATAVIQLIADDKIYQQARLIQVKVTEVHVGIRQAKTKEEKEAAEKPVSGVDNARGKLIELFKADLGIPLNSDKGQAASQAGASGHPGTDQPR